MLCLTLLSMTSCATPAPVPDACGWLHYIQPDAGFEARWTRTEKEQAVELNRKIADFCRKEA